MFLSETKLSNKTIITFGLLVMIIVGLGIYAGLRYVALSTSEIKGNLTRVEGSSLFVSAKYWNTKSNTALTNTFTPIEVVITSETRITRSGFLLPTEEELKKTGGAFYPEKLPKEVTVVDLETLKKDLSISTISLAVKAGHNISGSKKFEAAEVTYTAPIFK